MKRTIILTTLLPLLFFTTLLAEEGMWMLHQLPMSQLKRAGFELHQTEIYDPNSPSLSDAILQIGGGSGSFVSPQGLVITNHHVAQSALQTLSDSKHNYVKTGYEATGQEKELHVPGYTAYLAVSFRDVTDDILAGVDPAMSFHQRFNTIQETAVAIEESLETAYPQRFHFDVAEYYGGLHYYLYTYIEFKDIRLVYAPPESIGAFGGDVDNWMWPRHSGDFAFFRIYINPNDSSTSYHDDNIPFEPDQYLIFTDDGIDNNDFTFIIGYPGRSQRFRTSHAVRHAVQNKYPFNIETYSDVLDIISSNGKSDKTVQITYSNRVSYLNNYLKNNKGMLEGLKRADLLFEKQKEDRELRHWIRQKNTRIGTYGDVLHDIGGIYSEVDSAYPQTALHRSLEWMGSLYYAATVLEKWSEQKTRPNKERESRYTESNIPRLKERLKLMQRRFAPQVDAAIMKYFLNRMATLPEAIQVGPVHSILIDHPGMDTSSSISAFVDSLYANTALIHPEKRLEYFDMTRDEILDTDDAFINFAVSMRPFRDRLDRFDKRTEGALTYYRPKYILALQEWKSHGIYPDANFTPRLTYGFVKGYSPADAVRYDYITSIQGILEKQTGTPPFDAPARLLNLLNGGKFPDEFIDPHLETVPVNFLHTTDITGGNSGSPVMDNQGRFIGIAFDGNWESISADWVFNPQLTRSISVDARYILYLMDQLAESHYVLDELTIE